MPLSLLQRRQQRVYKADLTREAAHHTISAPAFKQSVYELQHAPPLSPTAVTSDSDGSPEHLRDGFFSPKIDLRVNVVPDKDAQAVQGLRRYSIASAFSAKNERRGSAVSVTSDGKPTSITSIIENEAWEIDSNRSSQLLSPEYVVPLSARNRAQSEDIVASPRRRSSGALSILSGLRRPSLPKASSPRLPTYNELSPPYSPFPPAPEEEEYESGEIRLPEYLLNQSVSPRPEEGHEVLPRYTNTLVHSSWWNVKHEQPKGSSWKRMQIKVNGTLVSLHKEHKNELIRQYTMAYAEAGLAIDYGKNACVVRVRLEEETLLLAVPDVETLGDGVGEENCARLIERLQTGANIAVPLEEMREPKFYTLPRRRAEPALTISRRGRTAEETAMDGHPSEEANDRRTDNSITISVVPRRCPDLSRGAMTVYADKWVVNVLRPDAPRAWGGYVVCKGQIRRVSV
ncbi:hypothetical protein YB2330_001823 [Saitoella coloradoensis]